MDDYQGKKRTSIEFSEKASAWSFVILLGAIGLFFFLKLMLT
jgi:ABC-type siderophore export system fused ATPase/permease subunit